MAHADRSVVGPMVLRGARHSLGAECRGALRWGRLPRLPRSSAAHISSTILHNPILWRLLAALAALVAALTDCTPAALAAAPDVSAESPLSDQGQSRGRRGGRSPSSRTRGHDGPGVRRLRAHKSRRHGRAFSWSRKGIYGVAPLPQTSRPYARYMTIAFSTEEHQWPSAS